VRSSSAVILSCEAIDAISRASGLRERADERREVPADPPQFPPFERLRTEQIYDSHWCGLRRDVLRLHDGGEQEYHVIEISDAVVVVPVLADGRIALIGQYRYPHGRTHWEVPAGRIAPGETPEECALRELREEAGCTAERLVRLPGFYPTNGISAHYAHAFAAMGCADVGGPNPESSEQILVREFTRAEVEQLLDAGRIADGFTALALLYWLRRG
jgi:ADP-ribose pyrophosphatase